MSLSSYCEQVAKTQNKLVGSCFIRIGFCPKEEGLVTYSQPIKGLQDLVSILLLIHWIVCYRFIVESHHRKGGYPRQCKGLYKDPSSPPSLISNVNSNTRIEQKIIAEKRK